MRPLLLFILFTALSMPCLSLETPRIQIEGKVESHTNNPQESYLARIELHTSQELNDALHRAQALASEASPQHPIAFILHGEEAKTLLKSSYSQHKSLVDLAQDLSQQDVVRIQVCQTWLLSHGIKQSELPPFIDTVRFAPLEINRLIHSEGYTYF